MARRLKLLLDDELQKQGFTNEVQASQCSKIITFEINGSKFIPN